MRCRTARRHLFGSGPSEPGRALQRHLDRCADCRAVAEETGRIYELDPLPAVDPPPEVVEATLRRMRVARAQRPVAAPALPRYLPHVAAAVGVLAVVGLAAVFLPRPPNEQSGTVAIAAVDPTVRLQAELASVEADLLMLDLSFDRLLAETDPGEPPGDDPLEVVAATDGAPVTDSALADLDLEITESDLDAMESIFDELTG